MLRVVDLGEELEYADVQGACVAPPYEASRGSALPHFHVSAWIDLQSQGNWGHEPFVGFGIVCKCPELFGCLEIFLGDWCKDVSRMAASRGLVLDHR